LDDRPFVSLMFRTEAFDDDRSQGRHSRDVVTVVRLLGDEPIRCPLFRRGSFLGDGRDTFIRFSFWREYLSREGAQPYSILSIKW
jgi:hypothetical protein